MMFRQWARNFYRSALSTITPMAIRARSRPLELGRSLWKEGNGARRIVGYWLVGASGLVFGIVVLGGLTRLTESGLSMVDWSLLHFRPPRTEAEWQAYFEKYQQFPEYQLNNRGMSLDDFKRIYWYEHAHRVYGRLLGMYVLLPSAFFIARGWVSPAMRRVLLGCSSLVIFQGLLGWYMVKSGLRPEIMQNGEPARVSQYRLAAHLGSAFVLYLISLSAGIRILSTSAPLMMTAQSCAKSIHRFRSMVHGAAGFTLLTALSGAFVAGLDAGMIYNSFPLMGDRLIPSDVWLESLSWKNVAENPTTVQFIHRILAISTIGGICSVWCVGRGLRFPLQVTRATNFVVTAALLQGALGICTLLYMVPIPVASAHQAGSLMLLSSFVWLMHQLKRLPK